MSDVKHIDPKEFKELGFLQECNRLFFHPHGLALELTSITEDEGDAPFTLIKLPREQMALLQSLVEKAIDAERGKEVSRATGYRDPALEAVVNLEKSLSDGKVYDVGDCYFSGCWDYRTDPEGVYYGDWQPDAVAKVEAVREERRRHYLARARMFGTLENDGLVEEVAQEGDRAVLDRDLALGLDIEPTTFVEPRDSRPPVEQL